ncbi:LysR family substrate-binding domain-containing protein [Actinosynnema sp. NPDC091369]
MSRGETGPIRLGYHGSRLVADRIVVAAGRAVDDVAFVQYDITEPFRALREGRIDAMVVKFGIDEPDLVAGADLAEEQRVVVVGARHPLADRESVSVEEVADHPVFDRPGNLPGYVWDRVVPRSTPAGKPLRRAHRAGDIAAMMALVAAGDAVHLSVGSLADVAPPGVRVVPVRDLPPAPVALAWRRDLDRADVLRFVADAERGRA